MSKNTGGPAFPVAYQHRYNLPGDDIGEEIHSKEWDGMALRDWLAGMAMQGYITTFSGANVVNVVRDAYRVADEMLKVREN